MNVLKALSKIGYLPEILVAGSILEADVEAIQHDADLVAKIQADPELSATVQRLSGEIRALENAIGKLK